MKNYENKEWVLRSVTQWAAWKSVRGGFVLYCRNIVEYCRNFMPERVKMKVKFAYNNPMQIMLQQGMHCSRARKIRLSKTSSWFPGSCVLLTDSPNWRLDSSIAASSCFAQAAYKSRFCIRTSCRLQTPTAKERGCSVWSTCRIMVVKDILLIFCQDRHLVDQDWDNVVRTSVIPAIDRLILDLRFCFVFELEYLKRYLNCGNWMSRYS